MCALARDLVVQNLWQPEARSWEEHVWSTWCCKFTYTDRITHWQCWSLILLLIRLFHLISWGNVVKSIFFASFKLILHEYSLIAALQPAFWSFTLGQEWTFNISSTHLLMGNALTFRNYDCFDFYLLWWSLTPYMLFFSPLACTFSLFYCFPQHIPLYHCSHCLP